MAFQLLHHGIKHTLLVSVAIGKQRRSIKLAHTRGFSGSFWFVIICLFATSQWLPAPIIEEEKPTPAPQQSAKPKPTRTAESKTARQAQTPSATPARISTPSKQFAGKWSGVMPEVPWGNVQTELVVDPSETTIEWQESGKHKGSAKAQLNGNTLSARIPIGFTTAVWFITPNPDGTTANIRMTAFMNDDHAVFRRTSQ